MMSNEKAKRFRELNSDYDWCADETFSNYYVHTDDVDSLMQDYSDDQNTALKAENERLKLQAKKLMQGHSYLMGVPADKITVEDALEAFGFGRNGLNY